MMVLRVVLPSMMAVPGKTVEIAAANQYY